MSTLPGSGTLPREGRVMTMKNAGGLGAFFEPIEPIHKHEPADDHLLRDIRWGDKTLPQAGLHRSLAHGVKTDLGNTDCCETRGGRLTVMAWTYFIRPLHNTTCSTLFFEDTPRSHNQPYASVGMRHGARGFRVKSDGITRPNCHQ